MGNILWLLLVNNTIIVSIRSMALHSLVHGKFYLDFEVAHHHYGLILIIIAV